MFVAESGCLDNDDKATRPRRKSFEHKIRFLKEVGAIDPKAYSKIRRLNDLRVSILQGQKALVKALSEKENGDVTPIILEGLRAVLEIFVRLSLLLWLMNRN